MALTSDFPRPLSNKNKKKQVWSPSNTCVFFFRSLFLFLFSSWRPGTLIFFFIAVEKENIDINTGLAIGINPVIGNVSEVGTRPVQIGSQDFQKHLAETRSTVVPLRWLAVHKKKYDTRPTKKKNL